MKTLTEYILESLIFEKKTLTSRAQKIADKVIDIVINNKNEFKASKAEETILEKISEEKNKEDKFYYKDNSNIFKIPISLKEQHYDLFFIINCWDENDIKDKINTFDFKLENNKTVFYIALNCIDINTIENKKHKHGIEIQKDTLVHEIRHFYDKIKGHGGTKNNTYDAYTINKYNKFLYYISQTEQNAFFAGFKQKFKANKDNIQGQLLNVFSNYKENEKCKNVEEFIEQFSSDCYKYRLENCFDGSDDWSKIKYPDAHQKTDDEETKLKKTINLIRCHNPLLFLEYKYYILDSYENFYEFISKNPIDNKKDDERKKEILNCLQSYNNDKPIKNTDQLRKVYKKITGFYNKIFSNYMNLIKQFIENNIDEYEKNKSIHNRKN